MSWHAMLTVSQICRFVHNLFCNQNRGRHGNFCWALLEAVLQYMTYSAPQHDMLCDMSTKRLTCTKTHLYAWKVHLRLIGPDFWITTWILPIHNKTLYESFVTILKEQTSLNKNRQDFYGIHMKVKTKRSSNRSSNQLKLSANLNLN